MPIWIVAAVLAVAAIGGFLVLSGLRDRGEGEDGSGAGGGGSDDDDLDVDIDDTGEREALGQGGKATGHISLEVDVALDIEDEDEPTSPFARILVTAVGNTDTGRRRKHNEDAIMVVNNEIFAIADGMGGYAAGEVASQMATDMITASFESGHFGGEPDPFVPRRGDELVRSIKHANTSIYEQAQSNTKQAGMGTTLVAARFSPNKKRVYIAHVGDSRCYRLRGDELEQLTLDHTLASVGITGPAGHKLIRALGVQADVDVDLRVDEPMPGDYFLLCSDGLSKMVPEPMIIDIVNEQDDIEQAVKRLIDRANQRGGKDNVSVILVRVDDIAAGAQKSA